MIAEPLYRLGTSSYIIPDDILPNVHYLAGKVKDIELILFDVDEGQNNLPTEAVLAELNQIAREWDLSYTVHLPLDLRLGADGDEQHISLLKARKVIERTYVLEPWAFVLHLDGKEVKQENSPGILRHWNSQAARALEIVAGWAGGAERLAIENLEGYPLDFWETVLERVPVSRCVDVGHLWWDGHDPLPYLERAYKRLRVIHVHGIAERDHRSLAHVDPAELVRVLGWLHQRDYRGVLTIEVFGEDDFLSSIAAVQKALTFIHR